MEHFVTNRGGTPHSKTKRQNHLPLSSTGSGGFPLPKWPRGPKSHIWCEIITYRTRSAKFNANRTQSAKFNGNRTQSAIILFSHTKCDFHSRRGHLCPHLGSRRTVYARNPLSHPGCEVFKTFKFRTSSAISTQGEGTGALTLVPVAQYVRGTPCRTQSARYLKPSNFAHQVRFPLKERTLGPLPWFPSHTMCEELPVAPRVRGFQNL